MTMAGIQPFFRANNFKLGYYDGIRVFPRSVIDSNNAFLLHNNDFCLIWKSQGFSFYQAIREIKEKLKIVDIYITEENVNSNFENKFT